jgi:hypothetical protein
MRLAGHLAVAVIVAQLAGSGALGGTSVGGRPLGPDPIDQLQRSVTRPLPRVDPPPVSRPDRVWVPDRYVTTPRGQQVLVPGHWERYVSPHETHVPPLVACTPAGECKLVPGGVRRAPELRQGP